MLLKVYTVRCSGVWWRGARVAAAEGSAGHTRSPVSASDWICTSPVTQKSALSVGNKDPLPGLGLFKQMVPTLRAFYKMDKKDQG